MPKIYTLEYDIQLVCVKAASFPEGVMAAYQQLQSVVTNASSRRYFGISYPNQDGSILYKACAEQIHMGEAESLGLESFTIKAGRFTSIYIEDHMRDSQSIGNAFHELLKDKDIDPRGYCLEMYKDFADKDVLCLVPLK